jgi:alkylmercury lyase
MAMDDRRAAEMTRKLTREGGVLDYGPDQARLLLRVLRTLAQGRPVSAADVDDVADQVGLAREQAQSFLRPLAERDADDGIVGVLGLSLAEHPHGFSVNGHRMFTWCAEDTLFLPSLLGQTATVESTSPLSREAVRLTVGPEGVQTVTPPGTVVSIALVDPDQTPLRSVETIWRTFCRHIHFFASREEATRWATGRGDIAILTPDEGFQIGRELMHRVLAEIGSLTRSCF